MGLWDPASRHLYVKKEWHMSTAQRVHDLILHCLFKDGEAQDNPVLVEGIVSNFGFHPGRLAESKDEIIEIIRDTVPDNFYADKGGGWSFLQLPFDRNENHWAEHPNAEALLVLAIGVGVGKILLPRSMWGMLPGGMPYVAFKLSGFPQE